MDAREKNNYDEFNQDEAYAGETRPHESSHDETGTDDTASDNLDPLAEVFRAQLTACLEECAQGRHGLFRDTETGEAWPEAARLRELAAALQSVFSQSERRCALADEFLDLCTIHGESDPGERRLARALIDRMDKGLVGTPTEERPPWW